LNVSSTVAATTLRLLPPVTISSQDEKFEDVQLNLSQLSDAEHEAGPSMPKSRKPQTVKGTVDVITPEVAAALDRTNSDRKASHTFAAMGTAGHMKQDVEQLIISPSTIRRACIKHRKGFSLEVKATFSPVVLLILHWDVKIMDNLTDPEWGN